MKKEQVEAYVGTAYPSFEKKLKSIEDDLVSILETYQNETPELAKNGDFRPGTVGRMLASLMACRFFLDRTSQYVAADKWDEHFQSEYTPAPFKDNGYFGHFKDIDLMLRFCVFHQFYHQLETTLRIICEAKPLSGKKPIELVNGLTGAFPEDFIEFFDAVRNTIHNNGYYQPITKRQRKDFTYELAPFTLAFKEGEKIDLGTDEVLFALKQLVVYVKRLLEHKEIRSIAITPDKN
jgi:hypothetical protein